MNWRDSLERVLLALWVGGLWAIGYLAAPALFADLLDRRLAGEIAGHLFYLIHHVGLACALVLITLALEHYRAHWYRAARMWLLLVMSLLVAVLVFYIQPEMQAIKAKMLVPGSDAAREFGVWHGVSSVIYLLASLLGLALLVMGIRRPTAA